MVETGDIVNFKNIVFEEKHLDHSFNSGRPCVCLGEINNTLYFMPLSSVSTSKKKSGYYFYPNKENNLMKISRLCINNLIAKRNCWYKVSGHLTPKQLDGAFMNIKRYHKKINEEQSKLLILLANNYYDNNVKYVDEEKYMTKKL